MTKKLDLSGIVSQVQKSFKDDKKAKKIGLGSSLKEITPDDCVKMPSFWTESTGTPGFPFGRMVVLAGGSDSGKTSIAIQAMKAAQEQGIIVLYAESEHKTSHKDMEAWGVDSSQVVLVQSAVAEELFELVFRAWDAIMVEYPDTRLLVIIDSLGNVVSQRDSELDLTEDSQQPGGKGKINRLGLGKIVSKMEQDDAAVLLISYTYDNMGSVGKVNAGGQALNFFSSLTYQTARRGWVETTEKGKKVRKGAEVVFKLYKNHINKTNPGEKEIIFRITKDGISYVKGKEE